MSAPRFILALEDGRSFFGFRALDPGQSAHDEAATGTGGEAVFCTAMTGYQEICTDPSFRGQITTLTYPLIDNYGINADDFESERPWINALVVREYCTGPSNWRTNGSLSTWLGQHGIPIVEGIDTRSLVRRLRIRGAMTGVLSSEVLDPAQLVVLARQAPPLVGRDLVGEVMPQNASLWGEPLDEWATPLVQPTEGGDMPARAALGATNKVVALDYGMKWNIARHLLSAGCDVTVLPGRASAAEVLAHQPDGVFLSNGPGDPEVLD